MKKSQWVALLSVIAALALALPVFAQERPAAYEPNLFFQSVWARSTASIEAAQADATPVAGAIDTGAVSAAYLTIANGGGTGVRLVSAASPAAEIVEIHEMQMDGDVMRMRPVEGGLDVAAGGVLVLEPGGYHLMLLNLTEPLVAGQVVPLTLTFALLDDAGNVTDQTMTVELAAPVLDEAPEQSPFAFSLIWARPAEADGVSGAYLTILNAGEGDDTLVGAQTDVAGLVEIHEMNMVNDVMEMRPVEGGVPVGLGQVVELKPGGLHIMLMDLPEALVAGTAFPLTLEFESGAKVTVGVPVYDRTMMEMGGM